jgi:beta-glucosidase/6-phospho-beta-glucosidase/beta-galactosidase
MSADLAHVAFPPGFGWGTATSEFQIEGGARDGGCKPSIWDTFAAQPGAIADGSNGDDACDHYRRYAAALHGHMGDRVGFWTTLNEPWCAAFLGHAQGSHAPGIQDLAARP